MARRLMSSSCACTRTVASSSSSSFPPPRLRPLPPRRINTGPFRPLLLASLPRVSCSPLHHRPTPLPIPFRSSFRTFAATKGSPLSSLSPAQQSPRREESKSGEDMTISSSINLAGGALMVCGRTVLSGVPDAVVASSAAAGGPVDGIFIGADFAEPDSRHVVSLGTLRGARFMACFRFKLWWMAQRMGDKGGDVPHETQFLLVETKGATGEADAYVVFLPLVEGAFRASLQGNGTNDALELCVESGDADTPARSFSRALFVGAAESDPFAAIAGAVAAAKSTLKTFRLRAEKKLPGIVDYFGWCTWDAFYQDVTQEGVEAGLRSLAGGGMPPKFVIIDDGWQSVGTDQSSSTATDETDDAGDRPPLLSRLTGIKENRKFQSDDDPAAGIKTVVRAAKEKYGLKYVYV